MKFSEIVDHASELLRQKGRVTYRAFKLEFALTDEQAEALKEELIEAHAVATDQDGKMLVWRDTPSTPRAGSEEHPKTEALAPTRPALAPAAEAERRQLTVMFCDLVGSTALSAQLDPEDYRAVVQEYQQTCAQVIQRYDGYLAQYLGDGLLVYFGYPTAHEDDARRAVRTGLEIVAAMREQTRQHALPIRIGIHTGLVVVGEIGVGRRTEQLALGETPNIAARIQGLAEPNTVVVSAATHRLIEGQFEDQPFGSHVVKGLAAPIALYHVQGERLGASPLAGRTMLTPLVGREQEVGLLVDRWEQTKEGRGQVVLLSGEPGIGKSRLAYTLKERVTHEGSFLVEARCSPYHQHSALYPLIDVLQRTLLLASQDTNDEKVQKLDRALTLYGMQESLPLLTALLSLPTPAHYPSLNLTPQKQKERTFQALVQLLVAQAERQATVSVWEDLHWADPSSLEFLSLLIEQIPTTKLLLVLTFRPEFTSPWKPHSHIAHLVLNRLGKKQVEVMIAKVSGLEALPTDVLQQIVAKTDGVPLFVEELTKSVVESAGERGTEERGQKGKIVGTPHAVAAPALAIPATLQEALLARLDRLSTARQVAQLGATLGREFSYELLQAVTPLSEADLHAALVKLVEAEILYRRGVGEQARYFFKHALIQDTAYQSLLKSARQQYHRQSARVLAERFPHTQETEPELLAHHYTEAGLIEQAIPYWQQAGQRAIQRSANLEAVSHLSKGLELLKTLPDIPERAQQELTLQIALGGPLMLVRGFAAPEVEQAYARARELCRQVGETPQLFPVLRGLVVFYLDLGKLQTACELGEQCLSLAQRMHNPAHILRSHALLGTTLFYPGEFVPSRKHLEQGIALYDLQQHRSLAFSGANDPGVACLSYVALVLWLLGYPDRALKRLHEALTLAQELAQPNSLGFVLGCAVWLHQFRREGQAAQERAEALITLSTEQGFAQWSADGTTMQGWALTEQRKGGEGIAQMHQGLAALQAMRAEFERSYWLVLLAEAYGKVGRAEEGLSLLAEALAIVNKTGARFYEAELYRLKGELTLQSQVSLGRVKTSQDKSEDTSSRPLNPDPQGEAEACFLKAIEIARRQQAKSLELRAVMSLSRLWQGQGKKAEARQMLVEIYGWFTEGFDTMDLQEAKVLLEEL